MPDPLIIAGFFPPPITGQGLATRRLADLLSGSREVIEVNLREGELDVDLRRLGKAKNKIAGYRNAGDRLEKVLKTHPASPVLWTSISPEMLGHARDMTTIAPAFQKDQRVYAVVHWGRFAQLFQSLATRSTARRLMRRLTGVVFLQETLAAECGRWIPDEKRLVIPNSLDPAVICTNAEITAKQARYDGKRPIRLLFLSHMIREKGYSDVLEAVFLLRERQLAVQAIFAGQWLSERDRNEFEHFVETHGLYEVVTHLGPLSDRSQVKAAHLGADVFLLPSYLIEGQPLSIIEAMNAGSPVITANIGGTAGMVEHGREGYLVPPKAPLAIADAIQHLLPVESWRNASQAARQQFLTDYSESTVLQKWLELL